MDRVISTEDAESLAKQNGLKYYETSAKENINITELFEEFMEDIYVAKFGPNAAPGATRETLTLKRPTPEEA